MFDLPDPLRSTVSSLRVECMLYATDREGPVRLVLVGADDETLATLRFTPDRARDAGPAVSRLLSQFMPRGESHRVADGLLKAAVRVWASRN